MHLHFCAAVSSQRFGPVKRGSDSSGASAWAVCQLIMYTAVRMESKEHKKYSKQSKEKHTMSKKNLSDFKLAFHAPKVASGLCVFAPCYIVAQIVLQSHASLRIHTLSCLICPIWNLVWVWSSHLSNLLSATLTSGFQRGRKQLVTLSDSQEAQCGLAQRVRAQIHPKVNFNLGVSESSTPVPRWKWQWIWNRCHIGGQRSNRDDLTIASPLELWEFQQRLWTRHFDQLARTQHVIQRYVPAKYFL